MATRLFFRSTTDNTAGYVATEKSTVLPVGTSNQSGNVARDLSTTAGTSAVTGTLASLAQTAHQDGFFRKFISPPLAVSDITAQTWTLCVSVNEGNNAANAFIVCSVYVLTASDTVRGFVYDSDTPLGTEWVTGAIAGRVVTFSGSSVAGVISTDRLCVEFWYHAAQSMTVSYVHDFGYNGTTDIVDGTANADPASYIETPQNGLIASGSPQSIPVDATAETEAAQVVAVSSVVTVGSVAETESAQAIGVLASRSVVVGAVTEIETSFFPPFAYVLVGAVTETETSPLVGISLGVVYAIEVETESRIYAALEAEAAGTVTPVTAGGTQTIQVIAASETESATSLGIGLEPVSVAETEAAQAVAVQTTISVSVLAASETETGQIVAASAGGVLIAVGPASETEIPEPVLLDIAGNVTTATESEAAQVIGLLTTVNVAVGASTETEAAQVIAPTTVVSIAVGIAAETETAQSVTAISGTVSIAVGAAVESEEARAVDSSQAGAPQSRPVTVATETEAAGVATPDTTVTTTVTGAIETEAAQTVTATTAIAVAVGFVTETEAAQVVGVQAGAGPQSITVNAASETEVAGVVGFNTTLSLLVNVVSEIEAAQAVASGQTGAPQTIPVNLVTETEGAGSIASDTPVSRQVLAVTEAEAAQTVAVLAGAVTLALGTVSESETANPVTMAAVFLAAVGAVAETETIPTLSLGLSVFRVIEFETARVIVVDDGIVGEPGGLRHPEDRVRTPVPL